ncbi:MAG: ABC transporter permease [Actinomycetota bacterium]
MEVSGPANRELRLQPLPRNPRQGLFRLREQIPDRMRAPIALLSILVPFAVWGLVSAGGLINPLFLPSPAATFRGGLELADQGVLWSDISATVTRVGIGFALTVALSVPLGLAMGSFPSIKAFFEPMIGLVRYMPAPAFIPLFLIWLGLGEAPKIALLVFGTVFFNTLMSADAAALVPKNLIDASYTLGAGRSVVMRKVIFPHALPGLLDAMRVNLAATWNLVVVAELIAATEGLGYRIIRAQRFLQTDQIFAVLVVIGVLGVTVDLLFRLVRNLASPWAQP